jgi:hypothetical protein
MVSTIVNKYDLHDAILHKNMLEVDKIWFVICV